ncbi:MAG: YkgJ family cysteine cluster protein [Opitutus sp.]
MPRSFNAGSSAAAFPSARVLIRCAKIALVNSAPASVPADCQRCGVCCFSESDEYVWVTGYDWTQLGGDVDRLAHFIGNRAFMKMSAGHCVALQISRAADGSPHFCCSVYDRRPEICRALERGSPECQGDLATKTESVAQHLSRT